MSHLDLMSDVPDHLGCWKLIGIGHCCRSPSSSSIIWKWNFCDSRSRVRRSAPSHRTSSTALRLPIAPRPSVCTSHRPVRRLHHVIVLDDLHRPVTSSDDIAVRPRDRLNYGPGSIHATTRWLLSPFAQNYRAGGSYAR